MVDVTELLADAAGPVEPGPDLVAITQRAGVLRRRAVAVRAAGAALVVVAAVVPLILLDGGGGTEQLRQADTPDGPATTATATATATPSAQSAPPPPVPSGRPGQVAVSPVPGGPRIQTRGPEPTPSDARRPESARPAPASPDASPRREDYPPAASCRLTTRDLQTDTQRTCRFTATRDGGWTLTAGAAVFAGYDPGRYRVRVVRDGLAVYDTDAAEHRGHTCADGVIRPGDLVELLLESNPNHYQDVELAAGEGYGC